MKAAELFCIDFIMAVAVNYVIKLMWNMLVFSVYTGLPLFNLARCFQHQYQYLTRSTEIYMFMQILSSP